jgi:hypothetical protein
MSFDFSGIDDIAQDIGRVEGKQSVVVTDAQIVSNKAGTGSNLEVTFKLAGREFTVKKWMTLDGSSKGFPITKENVIRILSNKHKKPYKEMVADIKANGGQLKAIEMQVLNVELDIEIVDDGQFLSVDYIYAYQEKPRTKRGKKEAVTIATEEAPF